MEDFIRSVASECGLNRPVVIDKDHFTDLQVMSTPRDLRGQGIGTKFLVTVCEEADRRGEAIGLYPEGETPEWTQRLTLWYERHGFKKMSHDDVVYRGRHVRHPTPSGR